MKSWKIWVGVLVALVLLVAGTWWRYRGVAPVSLPVGNCDSSLWSHTYLPERLHVNEACTAVEGRVEGVRRESDGDVHVSLNPDIKSVLNLVNLIHGHGDLIVEIICERVPDQGYAHDACGAYRSQVTVPNVGDRVRVTGTYVTDSENAWREIHPVTRIEILR